MRFRTKKREKLKVFDFWAFQNFMHMKSREKYVFHMLFGAFQITSRTSYYRNLIGPEVKKLKPEAKAFILENLLIFQ